jgi:hypothetical protein
MHMMMDFNGSVQFLSEFSPVLKFERFQVLNIITTQQHFYDSMI